MADQRFQAIGRADGNVMLMDMLTGQIVSQPIEQMSAYVPTVAERWRAGLADALTGVMGADQYDARAVSERLLGRPFARPESDAATNLLDMLGVAGVTGLSAVPRGVQAYENAQAGDYGSAAGEAALAVLEGAPLVSPILRGAKAAAPAVARGARGLMDFIGDESGSVPVPGFLQIPSAVSGLEQHAAGIVDLLRSGRADEITEAMLDLGDPVMNARLNEALWRNYDLPMDYVSRMERADNWPTPLTQDSIHGTLTGTDYTSFKGDGRLGQEVYVAPNTEAGHKLSAQFSSADQGRIMPLRTPAPLDTSVLDDRLRFERLMDDKNRLDDFRMKGGYHASGLPGWADQWAIDTVNEAGIPALKLHERDWVTSTAIFDPRNIRSRFARFDPRLAHLKNLNAALAGGAGIPIGLLAMQPNEEQY